MSITPESGKDGSVKIGSTSVGEITKWTRREVTQGTRFGSSESAGKGKYIAGRCDCMGTIDGKWNNALASPLAVGTKVTLLLYLNATQFYSIPAVIVSVDLNVDVDTGAVTTFSASYESDGAWTAPVFS